LTPADQYSKLTESSFQLKKKNKDHMLDVTSVMVCKPSAKVTYQSAHVLSSGSSPHLRSVFSGSSTGKREWRSRRQWDRTERNSTRRHKLMLYESNGNIFVSPFE
jgi:hypothetical protein